MAAEAPLKTFDIDAQAPDSPQTRVVTLAARDKDDAREIFLASERDAVDFSLMPPEREVWEDPLGHRGDDAHVDLRRWDAFDPAFARQTAQHSSHAEAVKAAEHRVDDWGRRVEVKDGRVVASDLGKWSKARYLAHHQSEPYRITGISEVSQAQIDRERVVARFAELLKQQDPKADPSAWDRIIDELRKDGPVGAVTAALYGIPTKNRSDGTANGAILWKTSAGDTFKTSLHTNSLTNNQDTFDFWDDATNEVSGTGYTTAGASISSPTSSYDSASQQARFDGGDVSWATSTITAARYAIVYDSTPATSATKPLIGFVNFGADVSTTAGTFSITWDATGIWLVDVT